MQIYSKDIKDKKEFNFDTTTHKQLDYNEQTGRYLYGRYYRSDCRDEMIGRLMGYEVVQPVKRKQPDGTEVYIYPSSEQFGKFGWFFPNNTPKETLEIFMRGEEKEWEQARSRRNK